MASNVTEPAFLPQKRHKISVACTLCRIRKSKCDGVRPVCGPCLKRRNGQQLCSYPGPSRSSPTQRVPAPAPDKNLEESQPYAAREFDRSQRVSSPTSSHASDSTDAMGVMDGGALKAGLLGTASAANFMRQMRKAVDGRDSSNLDARGSISSRVSHKATRLSRREYEWKPNQHGPEYVLPPRTTADRLMEIYWHYVWVIFPFVDDVQVARCYESLWTGSVTQSINQQIFHCILNLAFALACKLDPSASPEEQESSASTYFARARALLVFDLLDISDFNLVQALLLMSQFLQSTKMPRQCFQSIGLAIWIAQDLGLDLPATVLAIEDTRQREVVQRAWQGCIVMDRIAAMTFGRPMRLTQESLSNTLPDLTAASATQPSRLRFFKDYFQLHIIIGDVLDTFYTRSRSGKSNRILQAQILDQLMSFEKRLTDWYTDVPAYLKRQAPASQSSSNSNSDHLIFERQTNSLYARWLHTRMLLWRPFFSEPLAKEASASSLCSHIAETTNAHCQISCVKAAQEIVSHIHENLENERARDLYNAGTILIAASNFPAVLQTIPQTALNGSIEQAFRCLCTHEKYTSSARRCLIALRVLESKINAKLNVDWSLSTPMTGILSQPGSAETNFDGINDVVLPDDSWTLFDGMDMFWLDHVLLDSVESAV